MKRNVLLLLVFQLLTAFGLQAQETIRLGIIGLDTSHSEAFIKLINGENQAPDYVGFSRLSLRIANDRIQLQPHT